MKINKTAFITSIAKATDLNKQETLNKPQIAFVGRSNVGKSSLINFLAGNGKLARTSNTPGRTRLINYFLINDSFYFVDLPGYGFAKASKTEVNAWQALIDPYLLNNPNLKVVCLLTDIRHEPTVQDKQMADFLSFYQIPFIVIATKTDKLGKSQVKPALNKVANAMGLGAANVFGTSSENKTGKEALLEKFEIYMNNN